MIRIKNLRKSYNGKKVLKGLDLEVKAGETLVILGRSGAGKSVLLRLIMGLETQDEGTIEIHNGGNLRMGMLFQGGALFDSLTIEENTAFYLQEHPLEGRFLNPQEISERVSQALAMVGLEGTNQLLPSDLSGGMRKRAALARLIVYRPALLLYDEPTTGLDPITSMQINELIVKTQKELGSTSIVVTHDLCSTFHIADRIALNHEGKILYITTKEEFLKLEDPLVKTFLKNSVPEGLT